MTTPVSSMALVLVGSFFGSVGASFLKSGAGRLKLEIAHLIRNWHLALGVTFYLLSSVFFVMGVRKGELSVLYPLVSLGSVWTMFWSRLFFKERITRGKIAGLAIVLAGIVCISFGNGK